MFSSLLLYELERCVGGFEAVVAVFAVIDWGVNSTNVLTGTIMISEVNLKVEWPGMQKTYISFPKDRHPFPLEKQIFECR